VKVLITGVSGGLARMLAQRLLQEGMEVIGVDRRPWPDPPRGLKVYKADIRKRPAEDVFRTHTPDAVVHMATVTYLSARQEERYRINLGGTQTIFEHCHTYGVKHAVFVGRHTIYGAAADAPLYRTEAEPPLGTATYPALADMVAADLFAGSALWRYPDLDTSVLRLAYTLGPSMRGTLASFLGGRRGQRVPMVLGFDPLFQVMHEYDAVEGILLALTHKLRGIFNVAGPNPIPLSVLCRRAERVTIPVPEFFFSTAVRRLALSPLPASAINHVKYPVVIQDRAFRQATGYQHQVDEERLLDSFLSYSR
jgi:UDP-glucose 4-epimerase